MHVHGIEIKCCILSALSITAVHSFLTKRDSVLTVCSNLLQAMYGKLQTLGWIEIAYRKMRTSQMSSADIHNQ